MSWLFKRTGLLFACVCGPIAILLLAFAARGLAARYPQERAARVLPSGTLAGAYHVHSTASDGRADADEIAQAAARAGLSFVVVTDHNLATLPPPRFSSGVLLIFGVEVSTPYGHLVVLGTRRGLLPNELAHPVSAANALGAMSILAHPIQSRSPWTNWGQGALATGFELYSADSFFRTALSHPFSRFLPAVGFYPVNSTHALLSWVGAQPEATAKLLALSETKRRVVLCAHDAHGIPPYQDVFSVLAMYLPAHTPPLGNDAALASQRVLSALESGESYCVFRALGEGTGFEVEGLGPERRAKVGQVLSVRLPAHAQKDTQLRVMGPAHLLDDGRSVRLEGEGALQLEVWRRAPATLFGRTWKPWLVPSPIAIHK